MKFVRTAAVVALATASIGLALAQGSHNSHQGHGAPAANSAAKSPAVQAYEAVNAKMHKDMAIKFTGDADVDFVHGMIPHHEGAVGMARVVLAHGKDPEIRKLAEEIIKAQDTEIALMKAWLKKRGG